MTTVGLPPTPVFVPPLSATATVELDAVNPSNASDELVERRDDNAKGNGNARCQCQ